MDRTRVAVTLAVVCLLALISYPAAPRAAGNQVVISQVYGGGGNSGATLRNDFIELFNPGDVAVDLSTWSVQYASSSGTTWLRTNLAGTIPPGGYYLIQQAAGTGGSVSLPTPDASGTTAMSATGGKVMLVSDQATLTGACPSGVNVIDLVGFGSATCFEGTGATPAPSNTTAALRLNNGCTDTDNNSADFVTGAPMPRNTASPGHACEGPTNPSATANANPNAVDSGAASLLTVSVTAGTNPLSTGLSVVGDLTAIGGASAQPFFDDGTNGDVTASDLVFSFGATVTGVPGLKALPVSVADAQGRSASATIAVTINAPPPDSADVVISQVYGGGGNSGALYRNDFIVLFNRQASAASLAGWSVQYASAAGTSWQVTPLAGTIPAGGYYLIQEAQGSGGSVSLPTPDAIGAIPMAATSGKVALVAGTTALTGSCPKDLAVDFVGFGTANCFEGSGATPTLSNTTAALRNGDGSIDTDDNASDFTVGAPNPISSQGTAPAGVGSATPALVAPGVETLLAVTVTPGRFPASTGITVTGDLTPIGIAASQPFFDDGTNGDATAGDHVFSYLALVGAATTPGTKAILATIADAQSRTSTASIALAVSPAPTPIHQIQGAGPETPMMGADVTTTGVVTGVKTNGFFLQSPDGEADADPQTSEGIFVFTAGPPTPAMGDRVLVTGTATEFFGLTEIGTSSAFVVKLASGWPLPAPVSLAGMLDPAGSQSALERLEGMRVQAGALVSVAPTNDFGEIDTVLAGTARPMREPGIEIRLPVPPDPITGVVDCCIPRWDANPERIMIDSDALAGMAVVSATSSVSFSNVTGPLDFTFDRFKIAPDAPLAQTSPNMTAVPVPAPASNEFTVAGYNIEFFANAPTQRRKAALAIREVMRSPDVIGTIEILDQASLQALADEVNALALAAGAPDPGYEARLIPASPTATQNVGFLVKGSRVRIDGVTQERADETFTTPGGEVNILHDRPPLVLRATVNPGSATEAAIVVVVNHPRSFIDIEDVDGEGPRVREKRTKQAESIADLLHDLQAANPGTPVIAVGDYNAFQFNDGYTDPISVIKGSPTPGDQVVVAGSPDLVDPDFVNLTDGLPADQQYSFVFDGTPQAIDHVLVNGVARLLVQRYAVARSNADFPATAAYVNDASRPERNSDHDMPVAYFAIPGTPVVTLIGPALMTVEAFTSFTDPGATASDANGPLPVTVTGAVDVNVPGEYTLSYTATNGYRTTTITRIVRVVDTIAPVISGMTVTPSAILVPDHTMVDVGVSYSASDASGTVLCALSVSSNESPNGQGDGNTAIDWVVLDATRALVRAERSGKGLGRVYTLLVSCADASGNPSTASGTVSVPHNR